MLKNLIYKFMILRILLYNKHVPLDNEIFIKVIFRDRILIISWYVFMFFLNIVRKIL